MLRAILLTALLLAAPTVGQDQNDARSEFEEDLKNAFAGSVSAMNEVGVAYAMGAGVASDQRLAVRWFRRAAELGDAHGAGNVGLHYFRGDGLPRDRVLAAKWLMICHMLDALRCHPEEVLEPLHLSRLQLRTARHAAEVWLRARPDLKNNLGDRPWLRQGDYPTTFRF